MGQAEAMFPDGFVGVEEHGGPGERGFVTLRLFDGCRVENPRSLFVGVEDLVEDEGKDASGEVVVDLGRGIEADDEGDA